MLGWANVQRHEADEITLLCRFHHGEKTAGLLPLGEVIKANASPVNVRDRASRPYPLHYSGDSVECKIGDSTFLTSKGQVSIAPIVVSGEPLIAFDLVDNQLLLTLNLYYKNNDIILKVDKNELIYSVNPWDIAFIGNVVTLRESKRNILIEVEFLVPNKIHVRRGVFYKDGVEIIIGRDYFYVTNYDFMACGAPLVGVHVGVAIGNPKPAGITCFYLGSEIRALPDPVLSRRLLRKRVAEMRKIRNMLSGNS